MSLFSVVREQENSAATTFFYHLAGMNLEPWDYQEPGLTSDSCVQAVWKMSCMTHFPRAPAACSSGQQAGYLRPCRNVCEEYVQACSVSCCDESVQCVFDHTVSLVEGGSVATSGYADILGPSAQCTGAGRRSHLAVIPALVLLLLTLHTS
eukprot:CAMPEP_0178423110 /NCGR_PEP_ID=MMETSP0689_2-20121128/27521_1 /TAXON_ID=160604 /ORGANISM="Amphidinium massartii, Strain CS-259" /LENGTH=150 /DNA_ID=CAMNT_0020044697 /DNA_START=400 /DNA_END=849 /DNA_ORIENTATION=-